MGFAIKVRAPEIQLLHLAYRGLLLSLTPRLEASVISRFHQNVCQPRRKVLFPMCIDISGHVAKYIVVSSSFHFLLWSVSSISIILQSRSLCSSDCNACHVPQ